MAPQRRTGLWLLTTFFFFLLLFTVFVWGLNRVLIGGPGGVGRGTVLTVRLQGAIGEVAQRGPFLGPVTVREIDEALRRAADDSRVTAVFLEVGPLGGGYGKAQEVRAALQHFRDSGKPVYALLEIGSNLDLYIASAADKVYQVPSGQLILGMLIQEPFYRGLLDTLGVGFEVFASGPYKSAFAAYTQTEISDEQRQMDESLLDSLYGQWIGDVAADRGMSEDAVMAAFDEGLLTARRAHELGLVDALGYRDSAREEIRDDVGAAERWVSVRNYLGASGSSGIETLLAGDNVIALIHVNGLMLPGDFEDSLFGADIAAGGTIARYIREARQDDSVKAIVLRVDSGGGAASAADVMGREIELAREDKPVIVSMSDVAASGGYWIASKATRVFANRATYTGSIGAVMGRLSLEGTYEKLGVSHELLKRGENADLLSEASALRPAQVEILERNIQEIYAEFVDVVATGRAMEPDEVDAVGQGRVWTGEQALENGLVDDIGGLREALVAARAEAGIAPGRDATLRIYPPRRTLFEELSRLFTTVGSVRTVSAWTTAWLPPPMADGLQQLRILRAAGPVWTITDAALPVPSW